MRNNATKRPEFPTFASSAFLPVTGGDPASDTWAAALGRGELRQGSQLAVSQTVPLLAVPRQVLPAAQLVHAAGTGV